MADREQALRKKRTNFSPFRGKKGEFDKKKKFKKTSKKWEIEELEIKQLREQYNQFNSSKVSTFEDLPISSKTKKGLKDAQYISPTEIQRESIGLALQGHDILGAAKTGSGKTVAFLIPVLECLYRVKWNPMDGLGALIISPTRELAYQIFEVLRKVGKHHDFSAGLVIGGKVPAIRAVRVLTLVTNKMGTDRLVVNHLKEESERISRTNIVICTPGRMLQHMDETPYFSADNLHILVLDEADRCLDLGFQQTMNAIIANLPHKRQTLLFSATQTKSVKDLARLSLKEPMYVSVHENAKYSTPQQLEQSYIVCELHQKLDFLWSFVRNHLKQKTLVFISSCKQVRFIYETFKKFRPGVTVLCLHGAMKQLQRVAVYDSFCRKENAILFATDIAARGLDFPSVSWVVQFDCPEDANTYIHRVGRTARYEQDGEALLVLLPSEKEGMIQQLEDKRIPIHEIKVNPRKLWSIQPRLQSLLAAEVQLKEFAQRAFTNYVKSVYLMGNKKVFDVQKLDTDQYAKSLGLAIPPRIRFLQKAQKRREEALQKSNKFQEQQPECDARTAELLERLGVPVKQSGSAQTSHENSSDSSSDEDSDQEKGSGESESSDGEDSESDSEGDSSRERTKKSKLPKAGGSSTFDFGLGDEDIDDILTVKKTGVNVPSSKDQEEVGQEMEMLEDIMSNKAKKRMIESKDKQQAKLAKKLLRKNLQINTKVVFEEDAEGEKEGQNDGEDREVGGLDLSLARQRMQEADKEDKELYRQMIRERHKEKRRKLKEERRKKHQKDEEDLSGPRNEPVAYLGSNNEDASEDDHLPDPDKIYGSKRDSDMESKSDDSESEQEGSGNEESESEDSDSEESEDEDEESENSEEERPPRKKKRTSRPEMESEEESESSVEEDESDSSESSEISEYDGTKKRNKLKSKDTLRTDEAIALKLLGL